MIVNYLKKSQLKASVLTIFLLCIGTYAWQSFSQMALNESSNLNIIEFNKGGRLHDDYNGINKDVYVENYADEDTGEDIFARIRLDEYFEYGVGAGTIDATDTVILRGDIQNVALPLFNDCTTWDTYQWNSKSKIDTESIRTYRDLAFGGKTIYMPTFNKNYNSLESDINGTYAGVDGDRTTDYDRYGDYKEFTVDETSQPTAVEIADPDDEYGYIMDQLRVHTAKSTLNAQVISMGEWDDIGQPIGNYWVYDEDGWAYWAAPIKPQTATGLLVDEVIVNKNYDGEWYYGVNVVNENATVSGWLSAFSTVDITEDAKKLLSLVMEVENDGNYEDLEEEEPDIQAEIKFYNSSQEIDNVLTVVQGFSSYTASVLETGDLSLSSGLTYSLLNASGEEISSSGVIISFNNLSNGGEELVSSSKTSVYSFYLSTYGMEGNYTIVATSKANPNCSAELKLRIITSAMSGDELELESITSLYGENVATEVKSKIGTDEFIYIDGVPYYVLDNQVVSHMDEYGYIGKEYDAVLLWAASHAYMPKVISALSGNNWRSYYHGVGNIESRWSLSYMNSTVLPSWLEEQDDLRKIAINIKLYTEGSYASGTASESNGDWKDYTYSKSFLFSITEFNDTYNLKGSNKAKVTGDSSDYWLRSSIATHLAMVVDGRTGYIDGGSDNSLTYGVRPALWVAL